MPEVTVRPLADVDIDAITRIDAETGQPRWRIPVRERVAGRYDFSVGMMSWGKEQPQLAAVGSFLVIVTPSRYDTQMFVVIDPARRFGKPSVAGISTEVIWEHSSVGEDEDEIAASFGLSLTDVRWALSYETARRAA